MDNFELFLEQVKIYQEIEERRKNVEEKIDALMATNHQLVARIDALIMEMAAVKTAVAVNEAKQQTSGTRRRSTNN